MSQDTCPFCAPDPASVFLETDTIVGLWDAYPVAPGHALLIPKRHVVDWFAASATEQAALVQAIPQARDAILKKHRPSGFNVGFNIGEVAGQTVPHLHLHVIPRYVGDTPDPTGGVRRVIAGKGNYRLPAPPPSDEQRLIRGGQDDPFLIALRRDLEGAQSLDLAVAFVFNSGLDLIEDYLIDVLHRGGRIRFLAGDYNDVTHPQALNRLVDLGSLDAPGTVELRVFECRNTTFHPKAYLLTGQEGNGLAYVGSSNLTATALKTGVEWNYRVSERADAAGYQQVTAGFEQLFRHPDTRVLDHNWVEQYRLRRHPPDVGIEIRIEPSPDVPKPHGVQEEALRALELTRERGNRAGLVVLATGLGKTWLSAFDTDRPEFPRVLFVAHREEILDQAFQTFRKIRPTASLGRFDGKGKDHTADVVFGSVQALARQPNLRQFSRDAFDYIVIDEFHHAAAKTYRRVIDYFEPKFLLGLTATPERSDGGDLLGLCQENLVYRCDLADGIKRGLLSPFHYFGVPDDVDYSNIPWRSSRFDEEELTTALATQKRAANALEQFRIHQGNSALGFCCSVRHAEFMTDYFQQQGVRSVAVHSGPSSAPRARSLDELRNGDLDIIFAVDMFNEGVDLPAVDTVMMLRPTESRVLWFQQFGRGLRKAEGKERLKVVDYIGNHRTFLLKPQCVLGLASTDQAVGNALKSYQAGTLELPPGCEVTYDLETVNILQSLLRIPKSTDALRMYCEEFVQLRGVRPTASEVFHEGYNPGAARRQHGSWLEFVRGMKGLGTEEVRAFEAHREFLTTLETTPMTKSFKMVLLLAMLNEDAFPGEIPVSQLVESFARLARRSDVLAADVECSLEDSRALQAYLEKNPIDAWVGGRGTKGQTFFGYQDGVFRFLPTVDSAHRGALQELTRELCDWRLARYLSSKRSPGATGAFECRVSHSSGRPILRLPDRAVVTGIPSGWAPVTVGGEAYEANFAKVAVNVIRKEGTEGNELPGLLRKMFGHDAGLPGTRHSVVVEPRERGWEIRSTEERAVAKGLERWKRYDRREIPEMFGLPFSEGQWHQGFVKGPSDIFLLVTLEKQGFDERSQYADHFLTPTRFQWQSQNRQAQDRPSGAILKDHEKMGFHVHLFIRKARKVGSRAAPFLYAGPVRFVRWEGNKPITVEWELGEAVPERLWGELDIRT